MKHWFSFVWMFCTSRAQAGPAYTYLFKLINIWDPPYIQNIEYCEVFKETGSWKGCFIWCTSKARAFLFMCLLTHVSLLRCIQSPNDKLKIKHWFSFVWMFCTFSQKTVGMKNRGRDLQVLETLATARKTSNLIRRQSKHPTEYKIEKGDKNEIRKSKWKWK